MLVMKCSNRIDGLARRSEAKQAKRKVSFFHILLRGLSPEVQHWGKYSCLKKSDKKNPPQELPKAWVLADSRCSQDDNRD